VLLVLSIKILSFIYKHFKLTFLSTSYLVKDEQQSPFSFPSYSWTAGKRPLALNLMVTTKISWPTILGNRNLDIT